MTRVFFLVVSADLVRNLSQRLEILEIVSCGGRESSDLRLARYAPVRAAAKALTEV